MGIKQINGFISYEITLPRDTKYIIISVNQTDITEHQSIKVVGIINDREEDAKKVVEELRDLGFYAYLSTYYINVVDSSVNKSVALEKVLVHADCYKDDLYVIGDSVNDLEMLTTFQGAIMKNHSVELDKLNKKSYDTLYEYIEELEKN